MIAVRTRVAAASVFIAAVLLAPVGSGRGGPGLAPEPLTADTAAALDVRLGAAAFGRSGALRVRHALPGEALALPLEWTGPAPAPLVYRWLPVLGTLAPVEDSPFDGRNLTAPAGPGVYELEIATGSGAARRFEDLRLIVRAPFRNGPSARLGAYRIGRYPSDRGGRYAPPVGFMEVTQANQDLRLSEHFRVREFLTHDQQGVWPKYVLVEPRLLDKLELVLDELEAMGVPARHMIVMSGYRTPQYNRKGLDAGRASLSRHQYGDAADVWVDNDGDWYMDDLNGDARRDTGDARVMLRAVERVEARHPELVGGAGVYRDNGAHGPFLHIDVRGRRARW